MKFFFDFVIANWMLWLIALSAGAMLLVPMLQKAGQGALSAEGAVQLINRQRAVVVDIRAPEEFATGHVTGARNVPLDQLEAKLASTVKNKSLPLLIVCASGARAQRAVAVARKLGYEQAQALSGGLKSWQAANLPLEKA
ncbi:Rhodanese-related sulfurtransferase [Variovorax sp. OV329]|nr:Rhodanese-related sulfurtransferase [Variovorax sp. OV329]